MKVIFKIIFHFNSTSYKYYERNPKQSPSNIANNPIRNHKLPQKIRQI